MQLKSELIDRTLIITVENARIDAAVAIQFKDEVRAVTDCESDRVVMDMTKVDFLDSSGLGAVVASMKHLGSDRKLELAGLSKTVAKVFRLTRMDSVFIIHPDLQSALDAGKHAA